MVGTPFSLFTTLKESCLYRFLSKSLSTILISKVSLAVIESSCFSITRSLNACSLASLNPITIESDY